MGHVRFKPRVELSREVVASIVDHAATEPEQERGGLLFGRMDSSGPFFSIEQVHHVPARMAVGSAHHFSMDHEYAVKVIHDPRYMTYLGNWHSHLGYGGPSGGDDSEAAKFFRVNPERRHYIAVIADRDDQMGNAYTIRVRVYRNAPHSTRGYEFFDIAPQHVDAGQRGASLCANFGGQRGPSRNHVTSVHDDTFIDSVKSTLERAAWLRRDSRVSLVPGHQPGEQILRCDVRYAHEKQSSLDFPVTIAVSFPAEFPDGEVFVDFVSTDQTRQVTVKRLAAQRYAASPAQFVEYLRILAEDVIPIWLTAPVWGMMEAAVWELSR